MKVLAALAVVLAAAESRAREPRAAAEVVAEPVEVGAVFEVEITVDHGEGGAAAPLPDAEPGPFRVIGAGDAGPDPAPPGTSRFRLRLVPLVLPGDHEISGIPVGVRSADGTLTEIETDPIPVRIVSSLPPEEAETPEDIHDLRGPFALPAPPRWGTIALVLGALALLAVAAFLLWRRRRSRAPEPVPLPPPAAEAEAALARLSASGLLEAGEVEGFYERLAAILKRYAGRRFETSWSERTTGEILRDLGDRASGEHQAALPLLAGVLGEADLVKFSERRFRPEAARSRLLEAGAFLDRTRPPAPVAPDA